MEIKGKKNVGSAKRWLRVGILAFTVFSPVVKTFITYAQERTGAFKAATAKKAVHLSDPQEKLMAVGVALTDVLNQLKENPSSQELIMRGEGLTGQLMERSNQFAHVVADRSSEVSRDLAERKNKVSQELLKQSEKAAKELAKRGSAFWTVLGFGIGLITAGIVTYVLMRRRLLQQQEEENQSIQLSQNGRLGKESFGGATAGEIHHIDQYGYLVQAQPTAASSVAVAEQQGEQAAPVNATLIGIVSTKRYYPVETPFDQLVSGEHETSDVIYFTSEEEARAQGFIAAE